MSYSGPISKDVTIAAPGASVIVFGPFSPGDVIDAIRVDIFDSGLLAASICTVGVALFDGSNEPASTSANFVSGRQMVRGAIDNAGVPKVQFVAPAITRSDFRLSLCHRVVADSMWVGVLVENSISGNDVIGTVSLECGSSDNSGRPSGSSSRAVAAGLGGGSGGGTGS